MWKKRNSTSRFYVKFPVLIFLFPKKNFIDIQNNIRTKKKKLQTGYTFAFAIFLMFSDVEID